jgi:predicted nucleic acid-binding protein
LIVCADTSFLASRYIPGAHSAEADRRMLGLPSVWLTPLNRAELAHAINRHVFRDRMSSSEASMAWRDFEHDCVAGIWLLADLPQKAWHTSIDLARRFGPTLGVRTLDSLHVACALELRADRFWTFDTRQEQLAQAAGLDTSA